MNDLKTLLSNILGQYTPTLNPDGSVVIGLAGLDYDYFLRSILFIIAFYMFFKILNSFINGIMR